MLVNWSLVRVLLFGATIEGGFEGSHPGSSRGVAMVGDEAFWVLQSQPIVGEGL